MPTSNASDTLSETEVHLLLEDIRRNKNEQHEVSNVCTGPDDISSQLRKGYKSRTGVEQKLIRSLWKLQADGWPVSDGHSRKILWGLYMVEWIALKSRFCWLHESTQLENVDAEDHLTYDLFLTVIYSDSQIDAIRICAMSRVFCRYRKKLS